MLQSARQDLGDYAAPAILADELMLELFCSSWERGVPVRGYGCPRVPA